MGFFEKSWDSNGKMRGDWVADLGLAEVHLLGDHRGGLVNGGHSSTLCGCGLRSRNSRLQQLEQLQQLGR